MLLSGDFPLTQWPPGHRPCPCPCPRQRTRLRHRPCPRQRRRPRPRPSNVQHRRPCSTTKRVSGMIPRPRPRKSPASSPRPLLPHPTSEPVKAKYPKITYADLYQDATDYAPGTQKNVTGEVIRLNKVSGAEKMDAVKYIEYLEAEIEELNRQVARRSANGQNELMEYLKSLEPQNLKTTPTETTAPELAKLLFWLMVVGYGIRNIEVRFDMERVLGARPKVAELPPGENI